ncbi:glycosyltransferase [Corynebacterium glaucum]|uniref:glycosyltransferase n=1 Tax=Corynebacterium glaucum TaxID=187491 RepID=UPI0025B5020A|nr:glycosyltransferase [Corynebacterium glaucum]WJZ08270.1 Chondroitin synthase [Corynebacterium glaucum]
MALGTSSGVESLSLRPDVSVVIGFRDWGLRRIRLAVTSIQEALGNCTGEVIISDYGSIDPEQNKNLADDLGCQYVYTHGSEVWSRSRALNAGFEISQGELLVSTDADMLFSPGSFEKIVEISKGDKGAAYFLQCRDLPRGFDDEWVEAHPGSWDELEQVARLRPRWGMGGMMAISRRGFFEIRGFDERFHTYGGEDLDFAQRARRAGYPTVWVNDPKVRMYHMWHPSTREAVDRDEESREVVQRNREIVYNDRSFVRNYLDWTHRPADAPPLVTVAICTHNRATLIGDSIKSVLAQTMQDFEIVVVDDGGDDNTREVLESFADPRIKYHWQEKAGISAARNRAAELSKGLYTAVLDDDDLMHPRRLERQVAGIQPGFVGNVGSFVNFDDQTGELALIVSKVPSIETAMERGSAPGHSTWLIRTEVVQRLKYDETLTSGVDNNFMLRLLRSGAKLSHIGEVVTLRRMHSRQVTVLDLDRQLSNANSALRFIQWRLDPNAIEEITKSAKDTGEYPQTPSREAMLEEARLFLPDHLAQRNLLLSSGHDLDLPRSGWEGDLVVATISTGLDEAPDVPVQILKRASFDDMVRARKHGLNYTVIGDEATAAAPNEIAAQIRVILDCADSVMKSHGLDNHFVLMRRKESSSLESLPWEVRICQGDQVGSLLAEDREWLIFGNEFWEENVEDN